ncbi:uncharacterized protein LOC113324314 [Papaver somniferum]|uniref:uncharacterized protein LOC113324314 n=1 Tax=Papaver somniferum TaxID=3469 RepID=UPI000E6F9D1A|nr:uncharacterized protein LOC113324314 [Papaver somniferum]
MTRIITSRISTMIGRMVSIQHGAFIKGRNIHEKIVLASELVNEMNIKRRGGNVGLKIDITQAYDSLSWSFLFEVLKRFGFSECGRGLSQGDPISPILFFLAEEVMRRNISKLVQMGKIQPMVNKGGSQPTHLMFADDIFIFCNGHKKTLESLTELLYKYQNSSGQEVNKAKRKCFVGGVSVSRQKIIAEQMHMELSFFPNKYLGVIHNQGRFKSHQVWGIVEMMKKMLAGWMGKLSAFSARLTLVKFVLCSMPIYNMSVNFLWSGDPSVKKLAIVKWDEVNSPIAELLWKIENEYVEWTFFVRAKYKYKNGEWTKYHKESTIWPGLKWVISEVQEGSRWIVGDGEDISVKDLIHNGKWCVPEAMMQYFDISELPVLVGGKDRRIWSKDKVGNFTVSNATEMIRKKYSVKAWTQQVWQHCIHPYTSTNLWKILKGACATEESNFDEFLSLAKSKSPVVKEENSQMCKGRQFQNEGQNVGEYVGLTYSVAFWHLRSKSEIYKIETTFLSFPSQNQTLICCHGTSKGNPGLARISFVARNHYGEHMGSASGGLGISTNYLAEVMALIIAGEWEMSKGLLNVCFSSDFKALIMAFLNDKIPWMCPFSGLDMSRLMLAVGLIVMG